MKRWSGPLACAVVFGLLAKGAPRDGACAIGIDADTAWSSGFGAADPLMSDSVAQGRISPVSAAVSDDPFELAPLVEAPRAPAGRRATGAAPTRPWSVTGLVGARAAVLVKPDGSSMVVSVGQRIDSAVVVGISSAGVVIEDRGGRVLLKVR